MCGIIRVRKDMTIFSIAENPALQQAVQRSATPEHNLVLHNNPIVAMDEMRIKNPDVILFNYDDYPSYWESIYLFSKYNLNKYKFILLFGRTFLINDSSKAEFLGVDLLPWHTDTRTFVESLKKKLKYVV